MIKKTIITRFAPSPTGHLHIGGLWTALFSWLWAKKNNGKFILRIEDTDRSRIIPGSVESVIGSLKWLGLNWDEGPVYQSERLKIYHKYANQLITKENAYHCFCSKERLSQVREKQQADKLPTLYDGKCRDLSKNEVERRLADKTPYVIRMKIPKEGSVEFDDIIRGKIRFKNILIDEQVLIKADGYPTYHLASVIDDHLMEINPVIRAEEWLSSTPKHLLLYEYLNWQPPEFAHLPQILGEDRSKLSKRHGATSVHEFIKKGYLPEAMVNFLALLGWNPKDNREFFTLNNLIREFDLKKINKAGAIFNEKKLEWYNSHYIKQLSEEEIINRAFVFIQNINLSKEKFQKIIAVEKNRIKKLSDIKDIISQYTEKPIYEKEKLIWKNMIENQVKINLKLVIQLIEEIEDKNWNQVEILNQIRIKIEKNNIKTGELMWPFRVALSGKESSPGPNEIAFVIGKNETLQRIRDALKKF